MAPLVGREDDLRVLTELLQQVPDGGRALVLEGEGGVGKSSLWTEGVRLAELRGFRVLRSRSAEPEAWLSFAALGDLLEPVLDDVADALPPVQRRALEVALLRREPAGAAPGVRVLGLALLSCLRTTARTSPVLVALDDVHWTDPSSAAVIAFAARRLDADRVGLLLTVRSPAVEGPLPRDLPATTTRLRIGPLSVGDLGHLLQDRIGLRLGTVELEQLHRSCGGNPFFGLELARGVLDGTVRADAGYLSLPDGLQRLVQERLANLPEGVRGSLAATSALAAPTRSLLRGLGPGVERDLEVAAARGLVVYDGDRVLFTHPLLASACYGALPPSLRPDLHRRLAALDVGLEEQARHLGLATLEPDEQVAEILDRAAARAQSRGASPLAAELAARSLALTPRGTDGSRHRRQLRAGALAAEAGDLETAKRLILELVETTPGPLRARALAELAALTSTIEGFPASEVHHRAALEEPDVEPEVRVRVLCDLAWQLDAGVSRGRGLPYAEQALAEARTLGQADPLVTALSTVAELTFWRTGGIRQDLLDEALALEDGLGRDLGTRGTQARLLARADRFADARPIFDDLIGDARGRLDGGLAGHLFFRARMEIAAGDWDLAETLCDDGRASADQSGEVAMALLFRATRAELAAARGEDGVREELAALAPLAAAAGYHGAVHRLARAAGGYELSVGDPAAAYDAVSAYLGDPSGLDEALAQLVGSVVVEALAGTGRLTEAEHWLTLLDQRARDAHAGLRLLAARCRAALQRARGDPAAAVSTLAEAVDQPEHSRGVNALEHARTVLELGVALRSARHKRDARVTLERAAEAFGGLGALRWESLARSEVRRIGGRSPADGLFSETERLIVAQVLAGRRNREVAELLHLSPNTVAWNLSRIYRKVGVASRTELAARLGGEVPE